MKIRLYSLILLFTASTLSFANTDTKSQLTWQEPDSQAKPWARWWWMGNAIDKDGLKHQLTQLAEGGMGGVEICSIYGVKGYEDKFLDYLSDEWLEMYNYTISTAKELGMEVDLTCGTGWPFGGPAIDKATASTGLILKQYELNAGEKLDEKNSR